METSNAVMTFGPLSSAEEYSVGNSFAQTPLARAIERHASPSWLAELKEIVGERHVFHDETDLWAYCRDRSPFATFQIRNGNLPATLPSAVVCPASVEELMKVVAFSRARGIPVIPFGAGSGVLGGTLPLAHELIIDLKRLNQHAAAARRQTRVHEGDGVVDRE